RVGMRIDADNPRMRRIGSKHHGNFLAACRTNNNPVAYREVADGITEYEYNTCCSRQSARYLSRPIREDLTPWMTSNNCKAKCNCRVKMCARNRSGNPDRNTDRKSP